MKLKIIPAVIICAFILIQPNTYAIEEADLFQTIVIKDGTELTVPNCVAAAFTNSPKIRRAKYNLDVAKSNVGIAKSRFFPVISAGVGFYNENNSDNIYYNHHYRDLPSVAVSVNQLVWDFGKSISYIKMEKFYELGAEYEFVDSLCSTIFDVKAKYYALLQEKALLLVAQKDIELNEKFLNNAKNKADKLTAKLNLAEAKANYVQSLKKYDNAKYDLSNSMYIDGQPDYKITQTPTFSFSGTEHVLSFVPENYPFERKEAVGIAYNNSPDLQVLISTKQAMEQSLAYIKKTYYPELHANAGYGYNNSNQTSNNSLQIGVNLTSSINFMELKHSIKGADAQVKLADNEISLFKKDLYFEVNRALNNVDKIQDKIPLLATEVTDSAENLKEVENAYNTGVLNYVALQQARKDYISAQTRYINALYEYNIALIQVEMAMHCHIVDIHHRSEHALQYHSAELLEHLNKVLNCDEKETKRNKK